MADHSTDYPPAPWRLRGQVWLSLWRLRAGLVGTAFADYGSDGTLSYRELVVACPTRAGMLPAVRITDIWVDSATSRNGGRRLWGIPKELAAFDHDDGDAWSARADGTAIASVRFRRGPVLLARAPFRLRTAQQRPDGATVVTPARGTARVHAAGADWSVAADGPLGRLFGRHPFASLLLTEVRLTVGAD